MSDFTKGEPTKFTISIAILNCPDRAAESMRDPADGVDRQRLR